MPIAYKVALVFLGLSFCGLANTVGPTSAMLMIPTNQTWQTSSYMFSMNGSQAQLWPDVLTAEHIGTTSCSDASFALGSPSCVAGGYSSLLPYFYGFNRYPKQFAFSFDTTDGLSKRTSYGNIRNTWELESETWVQSAHVAPTILAEPIRSLWAFNLRFLPDNWQWSGICSAKLKSKVPVVRAVCIPNVNLEQQPGDTFSMAFPVLPEYEPWFPSKIPHIYGNGPSASRKLPKELLEVSPVSNKTQSPSSLRVHTQWLELSEKFMSTSIGAALFISDGKSSNSSRFSQALACSVDARWADGENTVTASQADWAWAGYRVPMQSTVSNRREPYDNYGGLRLFLPIEDGSWRRVAINTEWADALTPSLPDRDTSTLGAILEDKIQSFIGEQTLLKDSLGNETSALVPMVEHFLSVVVVDGMSRVGSHLQPELSTIQEALARIPYNMFSKNGNHTDIQFPVGPDSTVLTLQTEIDGIGYSIRGGTGYFAIVIMLLYMFVVFAHITTVLIFNISSSAWDNLVAIMALMFSSRLSADGSRLDKASLNNIDDILVKAVKEEDGIENTQMVLVRAS